jgi:hypothetical protein
VLRIEQQKQVETIGFMKMQWSFSELKYAQKKERTLRVHFLQELGAVAPWSALEQIIMPLRLGVFKERSRA